MKRPASDASSSERRQKVRDKLIGLGSGSISKSYYPELQTRVEELERFRSVMDQSSDLIMFVEPATGLIEDVVGSARAVLGLDREVLLGRNLLDVLGESEAREMARALAGESGGAPLDACFLHPETRSLAPLEMTVRLAEGAEGARAVVVARDVSERKASEQALLHAEERYRSIFENAAEGLFQSTPGGVFLAVNPSMAEKLGYDSPDQLIREVSDIGRQLYVDFGDRDLMLRHLNLHGRVKGEELRFRRRDGAPMWVSLNIRKVFDNAGQLVCYEGSFEDVTARKQAEEHLKRAHLELEQRVQTRTAELKRANERLVEEVVVRKAAEIRYKKAKEEAEKASRAKSEFLSMVSHELRTPLTSVLGFARIIQRKVERFLAPLIPPDDPKAVKAVKQVRGNLSIIVEEGLRLTSLINDVLDLAKLEAGKMELKIGPLDLQEVARRAMQFSASLFNDHRVKLEADISRDIPLAYGDRDRIHQVLVNLLSNAAKFTDEGSVTVRVRRVGDMAEVSVRDTGIGLDPAHFKVIFDKFQQIGNDKNRPSGTGLGLSICRHIVNAHGGEISVISEDGVGSDFIFTLPLASDAPRSSSSHREASVEA